MRQIATVIGMVALAATAACQDEKAGPVGPEGTLAVSSSALSRGGPSTYEVTITNLTGGQPLTPPLAVTHRSSLTVFEVGEAASLGVREIAENGNLGPLAEALGDNRHVSALVIALPAAPPPPILPGASRTFTITADRGAGRFSFVSMLICTNDGFTGIASARLPRRVGAPSFYELDAYDAGSELNTENFADIVPPCPALTGVVSTDPGSGTSDPTLAENSEIHPHAGIEGIDDLDPAIHGWIGPVATVSITRLPKSEKSEKSAKSDEEEIEEGRKRWTNNRRTWGRARR